MAGSGLVQLLFRYFVKTQLNGCIAVLFLGLDLRDIARTCFNHRDRNAVPFLVEDLRHANLFS